MRLHFVGNQKASPVVRQGEVSRSDGGVWGADSSITCLAPPTRYARHLPSLRWERLLGSCWRLNKQVAIRD
jgi:hypothetical protein